MEDKDLPEIGFKEKKERKGFLPWLRGRMGFGSRGPMGSVGAGPAAGGAGRALGAARLGAGAKFGAAGGILAAKGTIATIAVIAAAIGTTLYMNNRQGLSPVSSAFNSDRGAQSSEYIPAILRRQATPGSSLDMFADRNKGVIDFDGEAAKAAKAEADAAAAASADAATEAPEGGESAAEGSEMGDPGALLGKLQGASATGLSTGLSGGSSGKTFGFPNKVGQGSFGPKVGFSNMGAGKFAPMQSPKKGKLTAMNASKQAIRGGKGAAAAKKSGAGAWNQAKGVRDVQKTYGATNVDTMRSTQDQAWEGTTGEGGVDGGAGIGAGDGGAGIVTSPSLDNTTSGGGSGDYDTPGEYTPVDPGSFDVSPWASDASQAMMFLLLSAVLSIAGAYLISIAQGPLAFLKIIGYILCIAALLLAVMAMLKGFAIMFSHGQMLLGTIYVIGGGVGILGAITAMQGNPGEAMSQNVLWMAGIAGILGLLGSMMGSPGA